ncbi:ABC transporter substrate-binding protein [Anaerolentibacter hominis]|uniref:ABC transporter substrate-binding protein n=1 Tax=Anaerolentibacter hominis TaxID=3079009 RepID=UPI0031B8453D
MKKIGMSICLLALILTFTGCGKKEPEMVTGQETLDKEEKKSEVTIGFSSEPTSWDPCTGYGTTGPIIFSTLLEVNGNNELVNDLATDYTVSEDALTWTFHIRDDVYFTDGEKLTAGDVAFTYRTAKESASLVDLTMLDKVSAPDDTTVVFQLNKPSSTFAFTTAQTGIVPEHAYGDDFGVNPIGSGPYKMVQWDKGQQFILEANENYYGTAPEIKRAVFLVIEDEDARFVAAQSGQVDICLTSPTVAQSEIAGMELVSVASVDNRGITMPVVPNEGAVTEDGYPVGNDVTCDLAVRKAMCYGIDREQICSEALNGFADPAYTECDGMPWWNPETKIETDVDYACDLLTKAGWVDTDGDGIREKDGLKAEFNLMYFAGDSMRQAVAMSVANQAGEKLGISIQVEGVSSTETVARMFSEPMIMGWGSSNPVTSYMLYHSSNAGNTDWYNPENFKNKTVDSYLDKALNAGSPEEAYEFWKLAQWDGTTGTSMRGEAPWAFYVNMHHLYYVKEGLSIGTQKLHAHGAAWPLVANLKEWKWQ